MNAIIRLILSALFKLDGNHWSTALKWVRQLAQNKDLDNARRADEFLVSFLTWFPSVKPWVAETIRNIAVGYARKKGWIDT